MIMLQEIFKPIPEFDDYEVSNLGRIRSFKNARSKILKPFPQKSGHLQISLRRDGETHVLRVHRLVLETFVGPCPQGLVCLHKDDDPTNNELSNLRWGTQSDNILQMIKNGRRTQPNPPIRIGLEHKGHKLNKEQVLLIRNDNRSCSALSKVFHVSPMTIHRCKTKQTYQDV